MQQLIHVKIGLTDGVYPVREFITTGLMHDMYEYQLDEHTIGWVHKRWCTPVSAPQALSDSVPCHGLQAVDSATADWRSFLKAHWDAEHNHCQVEHLDEFYAIFRRAAAAYFNNKQHHEKVKDNIQHQSGAHEPRRTDALLHSYGRQRSAAAMSAGDKAKVRKTNKPIKPVEPSLFPDF